MSETSPPFFPPPSFGDVPTPDPLRDLADHGEGALDGPSPPPADPPAFDFLTTVPGCYIVEVRRILENGTESILGYVHPSATLRAIVKKFMKAMPPAGSTEEREVAFLPYDSQKRPLTHKRALLPIAGDHPYIVEVATAPAAPATQQTGNPVVDRLLSTIERQIERLEAAYNRLLEQAGAAIEWASVHALGRLGLEEEVQGRQVEGTSWLIDDCPA